MLKTKKDKTHVRLEDDVCSSLELLRRQIAWPVSVSTLANYVLRHGMASATKAVASTKKGKQPV